MGADIQCIIRAGEQSFILNHEQTRLTLVLVSFLFVLLSVFTIKEQKLLVSGWSFILFCCSTLNFDDLYIKNNYTS